MEERRILESWKAIASYLGRTEKTCRKWEHDLGLPVHRLDDSAKAHVFAYADELDGWKAKLESAKERKTGEFSCVWGLSRRTRLWLLTGPAIVLVAVAGFLVWRFALRAPAPGRTSVGKSIAILAFTDLSPKREYEYLCDRMAETLIDALNKVEGLRVPSRASAFYFKGKDAPPQEIGKRLNVDYVLTASVQADGEKLRVIPSLLSVADGFQVWSEKFDRHWEDIFAVEDDIARGIAEALKIKMLGPAGARIVKPGTQNLEAYNLYLTGWYYLKKGMPAWRRAIEFFERALDKDPNYAEAYAGIAMAYETLAKWGWARPAEAWPRAKVAALKALEIDSRNPHALAALSEIKLVYDWDFRGAENDIRKAIRDNPGNPYLHGCYANLLMSLSRFEEGLAEVEIALRQDPLSLESTGTPARLYYFARKYDLALEGVKKVLELEPNNGGTYIFLVQIYLAMGRYEDAAAANQRRREVLGVSSQPDDSEPWNAMVYALNGNPARAREILAYIKDKFKDEYVPQHLLAWIHAALGEKDEAFSCLERAYRDRSGQLYRLKVIPLADPLRGDPRFTDLLRRIGLEK